LDRHAAGRRGLRLRRRTFMPEEKLQEIMVAAANIRETERKQAEKMHAGVSLREQTRFAEYLISRATNPTLGFREHLRRLDRAIEE
jgi:4-hydroxy-4-methyl-2-oxoglutarate aldolase